MELKRVVITGLGTVNPIGNSLETFWKNLTEGVSGGAPITKFDTTHFKTKIACEIKNFDPETYIDRKDVRKMDPFSQIGVAAAAQAIADANINFEKLDKSQIGVILGVGIGGLSSIEQEIKGFYEQKQIPKFSPFFIPKMISDIISGHISIKYGLRGPNFVTTSACASSAHSIIDSANYIRLGQAKMIISGGSESAITAPSVGGFNSAKALSTRNEEPKKASRPFDTDRDGFVMGEGAGIFILEELEHALNRGAKIYAEFVGSGLSADAYHLTAPHPEGLGVKEAIEKCLENANIKPSEIDAVNTHGTSTPLGDLAELDAIKSVFGDHIKQMNLNSTKSMTGHLLGAAGAVEAIASTLSIRDNIIPPTINLDNIDENIDPNFNLTPNKAQKRKINTVLSNNFGFGGHNACILIKRFEQ